MPAAADYSGCFGTGYGLLPFTDTSLQFATYKLLPGRQYRFMLAAIKGTRKTYGDFILHVRAEPSPVIGIRLVSTSTAVS